MSIHHKIQNPQGMDLHDRVLIVKASDEVRNNNSTMNSGANDTELLFDVGLNETWAFLFVLFTISATTTPDMQIQLKDGVPLAGPMEAGLRYAGSTDEQISAFSDIINVGINATARAIIIDGLVTATTAGQLKLRWAQQVATAEDTKILAGSFLRAEKVSN